MSDSKNESSLRWLWFVAVLLGWPALLQLLGFVGTFATADFNPYIILSVAAVLATAVAWFGSGFAFERGAPAFLWVAVAIGSLPYLALAALAAFGAARPIDGILILGATLLPTLVVARRAPNKRIQRMP